MLVQLAMMAASAVPPPPSPSPPPACTGHTFADKADLKTAATEFNSNAAAATAKYGAIAGWCVSGVTDMSRLFDNLGNFNADISGWDTSRVTDMNHMFSVRCAPRALSPACCVHTPHSLAASRLPVRSFPLPPSLLPSEPPTASLRPCLYRVTVSRAISP